MDLFGVIGGVAEDIVNAAGDVVGDVIEAGADLFEGAQDSRASSLPAAHCTSSALARCSFRRSSPAVRWRVR